MEPTGGAVVAGRVLELATLTEEHGAASGNAYAGAVTAPAKGGRHGGVTVDKGSEFHAYVSGCLDSLHNYALLLARPPEEPEDLLQESLIRGLRGFDTFDRGLPFKAWMFGILRNTLIDRHRRRRARPLEHPLEDGNLEGAMDSPLYSIPLAPEDILLRQETIEHVREAIRRLPILMREVVELRDIEGLSYRMIATIIDRPSGTVMSRLYRGRNLLRTYLVEPRRKDRPQTRVRP
jgi:RNA polymerase sigma-70 factor, ECF subfamily